MEKIDKFFIYTNPLAWVYFVIMFTYYVLGHLSNFLGLNDWYYVVFKLKHMSLENKKDLLFVQTSKKTKFFYTKEQAWVYAKKIIEKEIK